MTVSATATAPTNTSLSPDVWGFSEARLVPGTLAVSWYSLVTIVRNPGESYNILIQPVMFTVLFGEFFGSAIADGVKAYLPTVVPGLIIINILTMSQSVDVDLYEDVGKDVFDRFRTVPIPRTTPIPGPMVSDMLCYLIYTSLTILTGYALGCRPTSGWSGTVSAIVLMAGYAQAITWIFLFLGAVFSSAQTVASFTMIILFPLTFLSSAMVPTSTLPGWLKAFVRHDPILYIVGGGRYLLDETAGSARDVRAVITGSLLILAVMAPLTVIRYQRRNT